jgi:hypothetical protein
MGGGDTKALRCKSLRRSGGGAALGPADLMQGNNRQRFG